MVPQGDLGTQLTTELEMPSIMVLALIRTKLARYKLRLNKLSTGWMALCRTSYLTQTGAKEKKDKGRVSVVGFVSKLKQVFQAGSY